jgi:hypothetical protein
MPEQELQTVGPFEVKDCALIAIATGEHAQNLRELRDRLTAIHPASIYYHFWAGMLMPRFEEPEFNNDFASWARHGLHDYILAERLALIDPRNFPDMEDLRHELVETIEERLYETEMVPWAKRDRMFHFKRSQIVVFDTNRRITEPGMLPEVVPHLSVSSIFYHFIDARRRSPRNMDDFSTWLLGFGDRYLHLLDAVGTIDPYFTTLHEIRGRLCQLFSMYCGGVRP